MRGRTSSRDLVISVNVGTARSITDTCIVLENVGSLSLLNVGLRIKLRLGLKLCKLQGRFLGRVNKVNYSVNYKNRQVTCKITCFFIDPIV